MAEMCLLLGSKGIKQEKLGQISVHKEFIIPGANRHANRMNTATCPVMTRLLFLLRETRLRRALGGWSMKASCKSGF